MNRPHPPRGSRLIGLCGWSGSGKTTLLVKVIPILIGRGHTVSTVKHAHHDFDIDQPGKDSHDHRLAGAGEVLISGRRRWALMHELRNEEEPVLKDLLSHLAPVDLILVEGFKRDGHPKIEVHRAGLGKPLLYPDDPDIAAVVSDTPLPGARLPVADLDDAQAAADLILRHACLVATL